MYSHTWLQYDKKLATNKPCPTVSPHKYFAKNENSRIAIKYMIFGEKLKFRYGQNNIFSLKKKKKKNLYSWSWSSYPFRASTLSRISYGEKKKRRGRKIVWQWARGWCTRPERVSERRDRWSNARHWTSFPRKILDSARNFIPRRWCKPRCSVEEYCLLFE